MYIEPNSRIVLLADIPLNPQQEDTYYFNNSTQQFNTFYAKRIAEFTRQSYQRIERGWMRLDINAERIYKCNYCMFQNTAYGNKWFYAFVIGVEYVNDNASRIQFQIDEIQTWFFEHHVPPCFVERQHSTTDGIGDNIEPEPVSTGDLVPNDYIPIHGTYQSEKMRHRTIVVSWIDPDIDLGEDNKGNFINGTFTSGVLKIYDGDDSSQVQDCMNFIKQQMLQHPESIISIYMCPMMATNIYDDDSLWLGQLANAKNGAKYNYKLPTLVMGAKLNGYTPKNNKLYTYPYNCIKIATATSQNLITRYEFFDDLTPTFEETWVVLEPVSSSLRPTKYRNITESTKDMCVTLDGFPMCMYSGDAYKAWLAQNSLGVASNLAITGLATVLGFFLGGPIGAGAAIAGTSSFLHQTANAVSEAYKSSIQADNTGGQASGCNAWAHDMMDYYASRMSCNFDTARSIDDFFTAFGYAMKRVMRPNICARRSFTYVKTIGAIVTGALPADSKAEIAKLYDSGIRFWNNHTSFGNLNIDNYVFSEHDSYQTGLTGAGLIGLGV